jgi:hypothetical protein
MWYVPDPRIVRVAVLAPLAILIVSYYFFNDPATASWSIPCLLHRATGWSCWGCGGQRAFHQLLHGNWVQALRLNALIFPVSALMGLIVISELTQKQPNYGFLRKKSIPLCAAVILFGFTILRNLL